MPARRPERIAERIREEVSQIVLGDMHDRRIGFVTVTGAEISPDLRHARIFVSILGSDEQVGSSLKALNAAAGFVRRQLGRGLRLRYTPQLHFVHDSSIRTATRIEEILKEENDKLRGPDREEDLAPIPDRSPLDAGQSCSGAADGSHTSSDAPGADCDR